MRTTHFDTDVPVVGFEYVAGQHPDALAIRDGDRTITYAQLDGLANQFASHLSNAGVSQTSLVAICLNRSIELIVAILATLKSGGAYLPLDPDCPQARLQYVCQDSAADVVITNQQLCYLFGREMNAVLIDGEWASGGRQTSPIHGLQHTDRDLMYVIYTSGSTGEPKGVEIENRGAMNLIDWYHDVCDIDAKDQLTFLANPAFDASVLEIWSAILAGACLHIVPPILRSSPKKLQRWMILRDITVSFIPTPVAENLLSRDWAKGIALRWLLVGGDRLRSYPRANLPFSVLNAYGPTEDSVASTSYLMSHQPHPNSDFPPIGKPIRNHTVYVLDDRLNPVPKGQSGRLFVGGIGLARGYRNRPDLTNERFMEKMPRT